MVCVGFVGRVDFTYFCFINPIYYNLTNFHFPFFISQFSLSFNSRPSRSSQLTQDYSIVSVSKVTFSQLLIFSHSLIFRKKKRIKISKTRVFSLPKYNKYILVSEPLTCDETRSDFLSSFVKLYDRQNHYYRFKCGLL